MAFATDTFRDVDSFAGFGAITSRLRPHRGLLSTAAFIGGGTVAFAWVVATLITTQTMVMSVAPGSVNFAAASLMARATALVSSRDRVTHAINVANPARPLTDSTLQMLADAAPGAAHTTARIGRLPMRTELAEQLAARMRGDVAPPATATAAAEAWKPVVVASLPHPVSMPANRAPLAPADALSAGSPLAALPASPSAALVAGLPHPNLFTAPVEQPPELALADATPPATDAFIPFPAPTNSLLHPLSVPAELPSGPVAADAQPSPDDTAMSPSAIVAAEEEATATALSDAAMPPISNIPLPAEAPLERPGTLALAEAPADDALPESVPLPAERPRISAEAAPEGRTAPAAPMPPATPAAPAAPTAPTTSEDRPRGGLLARLFGGAQSDGGSGSLPGTRGVAVYDIEAKTVYLPSGERLEAHSGLGIMRDNPRYVHAKNTGPTPPSTYALTLRESLFHGVEAIRLTPVSGGNPYGRVGLLAHTYMLGAGGNSNGCVVFKDYRRFLKAYKNGEVKRLVVVTRMSAAPFRVASR
jgi:hypothetical protein